MKKILSMLSFVLMLVCVGFAFTSCGDDEEDDFDPSTPIVGTWKTVEQYGAYGMVTYKKNGTFSFGVYIPDEMMRNEDFIRESLEKTRPKIEGTYSTSGNKLSITVTKCALGDRDLSKFLKVPKQTATYSLSKDNNKLTLTLKDYYTGVSETQVYTRM